MFVGRSSDVQRSLLFDQERSLSCLNKRDPFCANSRFFFCAKRRAFSRSSRRILSCSNKQDLSCSDRQLTLVRAGETSLVRTGGISSDGCPTDVRQPSDRCPTYVPCKDVRRTLDERPTYVCQAMAEVTAGACPKLSQSTRCGFASFCLPFGSSPFDCVDSSRRRGSSNEKSKVTFHVDVLIMPDG